MARNSRAQITTTITVPTTTVVEARLLLDDLIYVDHQEVEDAIDDFSYWELVNPFDSGDSDTESLHSFENGFLSWQSLITSRSSDTFQETLTQSTHQAVDDDVIDDVSTRAGDDGYGGYGHFHGQTQNAERTQDVVGRVYYRDGYQHGYRHQYYVRPAVCSGVGDLYHDDEEEEDEEEEEEYDGYGLDDELVPWNVSGKLGRQRMRKLGKRICTKMSNSKRGPYQYVKPGCVHGKHGLGMKA